jgi:hypothetical protein
MVWQALHTAASALLKTKRKDAAIRIDKIKIFFMTYIIPLVVK